jgi:hypothetical protein
VVDKPEGGKPKSKRGGKRPGAGRKPKGYVPPATVAGIDLVAALATPAPDDIASLAHTKAQSALDTLVKQLAYGTSEAAKVSAANAILDRGYGKPSVDVGGDPVLPFLGQAPPRDVGLDLRTEARKYATLAIEVLNKIASSGESEGARVSAARSLWDRGLGTVATAKLPDDFGNRPIGKKEELQRAAEAAGSGRFAPPPPPRGMIASTTVQ